MKKQTSVILSMFLFVSLACAARSDGFIPVMHNNLLSTDFAFVDTDKYLDTFLKNGSNVNLGWGGPTQIQNGIVVSDQAYVESTLLQNGGYTFGDINNNGKIDVGTFMENLQTEETIFYIYYNQGNRQLSAPQILFSFTSPDLFMSEKIIDVDGDGYPDIICDVEYGIAGDPNTYHKTTIFWDDNGVFSYDNKTEILHTYFDGIGIADLNNNGLKDLILFDDNTNSNTHNIEIYMQTSPKIFTLTNIYIGGGNGYKGPISIGDFNGDGYQDFITIKYNPVGQYIIANEVEFFANNSGNGSFTEIPVWTDITMQYNVEFLTTIGCSGDIAGDGHIDFVLGRSGIFNPSTPTWLQAWYCAPLGNAITFETQVVTIGSNIDFFNGKGYIGDVNNDGTCDIIYLNTIYYGYKNSTTPVSNSGGGGGGPVGPFSIAFAIILGLKKHIGKHLV